jgi:hypothetical protein
MMLIIVRKAHYAILCDPMPDSFLLPVYYNGTEKEYPAQMLRYGYNHKIQVIINSTAVAFEHDEEGSYRAVIDPAISGEIPISLLQAVSETLKVLFE